MKLGPLIFAALVAAFLARRYRRLDVGLRLVCVLLAVGLAVYGSGVVQLPNLERVVRDLGDALGPYTYALVGVMAFLETGAFIGLVAPGELTVVLGGVIAGQGRIDVVALIALVWLAAVAGDLTSYALGRRLGRGFLLRHGPRVKITAARLEQCERFFARYGGATILIGRFIGLLRALTPFVAGASRMAPRRFLAYDVAAAGLWAATFVLLGYIFWHSFDQVISVAKQGGFALATVVVVVVGTIAVVRHFRLPEHRAQARRALEREQRVLLRPLAQTALASNSHALGPVIARLARARRFVRDRLTPGKLGLELTTLLAGLLVGGFVFGALAGVASDGRQITSDSEAMSLAATLRSATAVDVARVVTDLGSSAVVGAVVLSTVGFLLLRRRVTEASALAAGALLTWGAVFVVKAAVDRPRPLETLVDTSGSSFPSGHAAFAVAYVAVAIALARSVPRLVGRATAVVAAAAVAALIGLTRVYLGAHYWSDVIAGWGLSAAVFSLCGIVALIVAAVRRADAQR